MDHTDPIDDIDDLRERPIGVFDSGLGGLTAVRELSRALPGEDILYFGDTARVPYGIKTLSTVRRFVREVVTFLLNCRPAPKMLVVACNTATAAAIDLVRELSPVEVVDVIGPGAAAAVEAAAGPIGVIATESTIDSQAYTAEIQRLVPGRQVIGQACPLLVPIVEEGRNEFDPIVLSVLSGYLRDLQRLLPPRQFGQTGESETSATRDNPAGALILGCTHYPLLEGAIARVMGPCVPLINSAKAAAAEVHRRLSLKNLHSQRTFEGRLTCFTTDNPDRFRRLGERFGGRRVDSVELVNIDEQEIPSPSRTPAPS